MKIRAFVILLCLVFNYQFLFATHIVGGSISLKYISGNNYELKLKVLRDCYNGTPPFDGQPEQGGTIRKAIVGMFDLANDRQIQYIDMGVPVVQKLQLTGPNCANAPNVCTELGIYTKIISFNPVTYNSNKGYYFSYQRCCRNNIIQNIVAPQSAAIALYAEVPPFIMRNSTPEFTNNPFTFLCKDNPFIYNYKFIEPNGDSLHYSLVTPLNGKLDDNLPHTLTPESGPYPSVAWLPGYSNSAELKGDPPLTINPQNGEISVTPSEVGVFVAAIKVEEFRNGVKIGEVRLELQFSVTNCLSNPFPSVVYKNSNGTFSGGNFSVQIPNKLCFDILASDINDSLQMKVTGLIFNDTNIKNKPYFDSLVKQPKAVNPFVFEGLKTVSPRVCWQTDCSLTGIPLQVFQVEVTDNGCPIPKIINSSFSIRVDSMRRDKPTIWIDQDSSDGVDLQYVIRIPNEKCLDIKITDPADSIAISFTGNAFTDTSIQSRPIIDSPIFQSFNHATSRFCWKTDCSSIKYNTQPAVFNIKVTDRGTCVPSTTEKTFLIGIDSLPLVNPPDLLCMTLVNENETMIEYGDSTLNDPNYLRYHIYRAVNSDLFEVYDSVYSRVVRTTYLDAHSPQNRTTNYRYYFTAVNQCETEGPHSDLYETLSNLKPTPDQQELALVTVVDNESIKLIWPKSWEQDFARYFIFKTKSGSTNFVQIADKNKIFDTVFIDHDVNVHEQSYCYHIIMKDTCENYGPVGKVNCSILLKGESIPFVSQLNWTPYTFWDNGTRSYQIYKADLKDPFGLFQETSIQNITLDDDQLNRKTGKFNYYVTATEKEPLPSVSGGATATLYSQSNQIELIQAPYLYIPNAYTPNQDGVNDDWGVRDVFVKDYELKVFNKWGQAVFTTTDKNVQWRGENMNNEIVPADVYVYVINYTGWDDSAHIRTGNVTLLK